MRPSARKADTKTPSTETSSSMMRDERGLGDDHVVQHVGRLVGAAAVDDRAQQAPLLVR